MLEHFHTRIAEKARDVSAAPVLIVAFGDSVTQGFTSTDVIEPETVYHRRVQVALEQAHPLTTFSVLNAGVAMDAAADALRRLERDVLRHQPDLVLVAFGLNDATAGPAGLPAFERVLTSIVRDIRAGTAADVVLLTPNFMVGGDGANVEGDARAYLPVLVPLQREGVVAAYADAIRQVAAACDAPVADVYRAWEELADTGRDPDTLLANGLNHPTAEGHALTANLIMRLLS